MSININSRENFIKKINLIFDDNEISKKIENSIFIFSENYANNNDVLFLINDIYETKCNEIQQYFNKNDNLSESIKSNKLDPSNIGNMKPEEFDPDKYENIINKKKLEENDNIPGSSIFKCPKCKKSNCEISTKQTRSGDEAPSTFVQCLECGYKFRVG